jgi:hypothetical protein
VNHVDGKVGNELEKKVYNKEKGGEEKVKQRIADFLFVWETTSHDVVVCVSHSASVYASCSGRSWAFEV